MSVFSVSRDLDLLAPFVKSRIEIALNNLQKQGVNAHVFEAYRSPQRQDQLYAQGRTAPGKIVTKAQGFFSFHQFGLAVDWAGKDEKGEWTWNIDYRPIIDECKRQGFTSLEPMERAHVEINCGMAIKDVYLLYLKNGGSMVMLHDTMEELFNKRDLTTGKKI